MNEQQSHPTEPTTTPMPEAPTPTEQSPTLAPVDTPETPQYTSEALATPSPFTAQPTQAQIPPQPAADPGKTLGIIGLILSFLGSLSVVGLILSIIAFIKSRKAHYRNRIALTGIVVGSLMLIFTVYTASLAIQYVNEALDKCENGARTTKVYGFAISCPNTSSSSQSASTSTASAANTIDVSGSPVTLEGRTVTSRCFTFTAPADYIINPNSKTCQTELRMSDANRPSGEPLSAIRVVAQSNIASIDAFFSGIEDVVDRSSENSKVTIKSTDRITLNGQPAGKAVYTNAFGLEQTAYFIPDNSNTFSAGTSIVTSYVISGPSYNSSFKSTLESVLSSFKIKST